MEKVERIFLLCFRGLGQTAVYSTSQQKDSEMMI